MSIINSWSLLKLMSIVLLMPSNHLILCCPLLFPPSIFLSIRVFSNESVLRIMWPKYWGFSFSISPSNEYSGLISFRIDWFDFLAIQGTLKNLLKYHHLKASIHQHSAFFMVQLSHPYMTTRKTIALTIQTIVGKVMSLLFNMLSRFVIAFHPRSKCLLIYGCSPVHHDFRAQTNKTCHCFDSYSIFHEVMGLNGMIYIFLNAHSPLSPSSRGSLHKGSQIAKVIFRKKKGSGGISLPDFKTIVIKTLWY